MSNSSKTSYALRDMIEVGVMAAIIFVLTYFVKITVVTPAGPTMLKIANGFCLLAGILFGGFKGGLAAGLGSMLYDLLDPRFLTGAPLTFVFFFLMAWICGSIAAIGEKREKPHLYTLLGAVTGAFSYVVLYFTKSVISKTLETVGFSTVLFEQTGREAFHAAFIGCLPKLLTSTINAFVGIFIAVALAPALKAGLKAAGYRLKGKNS